MENAMRVDQCFSFGTPTSPVTAKLTGFQLYEASNSVLLGMLLVEKRQNISVPPEFSPDHYHAEFRFTPRHLTLTTPEFHADLVSTLSSSLALDAPLYDELAPRVLSLARQLAKPDRSMLFFIRANLEILTVGQTDADSDDDSDDSMSLSSDDDDSDESSSSESDDSDDSFYSSSSRNSFPDERAKAVIEVLMEADNLVAGEDGKLGACSICLDDLSSGGERLKMPCHDSHVFHQSCLLRWFHMNKNTCPICRFHLQFP